MSRNLITTAIVIGVHLALESTRASGQCAQQMAELLPASVVEDDHFGQAVAAFDGRMIVGGSFPPNGAAVAFQLNGSNWEQIQTLVASDGQPGNGFGVAAAIWKDVGVIGASGALNLCAPTGWCATGAAYVFRYDGTTWVEEQKLVPPDPKPWQFFASSVAVSDDAILIGARGEDQYGTLSGAAYIFRFDGTSWVQEQKLVPTDGIEWAQFGNSVALANDFAVIGAPGDDDHGPSSGAVYIFHYVEGVWQQEQKLVPADVISGDDFGEAVSASGGFILVGCPGDDIGASNSGSAYVFTYDGAAWVQQQQFGLSDPASYYYFGSAVCISGDHALIAGSHYNYDNDVYAFRFENSSWVLHGILTPNNYSAGDFGTALATWNGLAVIGAPGDNDQGYASGSAYVFELAATAPVITQPPVAQTVYGGVDVSFSVSVCSQMPVSYQWRKDGTPLTDGPQISGATGPMLTIGAVQPSDSGSYDVVVSNASGSTTSAAAVLTVDPCVQLLGAVLPADGAAHDRFGYSLALRGSVALVGAPHADPYYPNAPGAAYVLRFDGASWIQEQKLTAPDPQSGDKFGSAVAVGDDLVIVGAPNHTDQGIGSGAAYIFAYDGATWILQQTLLPADPSPGKLFGYAVAITGDLAVIGSPGNSDNGYGSGAVYVFTHSDDTWSQQQKLVPTTVGYEDHFGAAVALGSNVLMVGTPDDDEAGPTSGAVYVFVPDRANWIQQQKLLPDDVPEHAFPNGGFGTSLGLDGDVAIVGSPNLPGAGYPPVFTGAAIYRFDGSLWALEQKISVPTYSIDGFGISVAVSGNLALVGAHSAYQSPSMGPPVSYAGAAFLYRFDGTTWFQEVKLSEINPTSYDQFGYAVALSGDFALVGVPSDDDLGTNSGSVDVFDLSPASIWITKQPEQQYVFTGQRVLLSVTACGSTALSYQWRNDGVALDDGDRISGALTNTLVIDPVEPSDTGLYDVVISDTGSTVVSAAASLTVDGCVEQLQEAAASDSVPRNGFGYAVAVSGDVAVIGTHWSEINYYTYPPPPPMPPPPPSRAYAYRLSDAGWNEEQKLLAYDGVSNDRFGSSVAVYGDRALVGAYQASEDDVFARGAVYPFAFAGGQWIGDTKLMGSQKQVQGYFGSAIAIDGDVGLIGAPGEDGNTSRSGAAYVFRFDGQNWNEEQRLVAPNGRSYNSFGAAVSISGDLAVVGEPGDDGDCPPWFDCRYGAVHVFRFNGSAWIHEARLIAADADYEDGLGARVAVRGDLIVASATGDDDQGSTSGSAYVFRHDASGWLQQQKILPGDGGMYHYFGYSLGISNDVVAIGTWRGEDECGSALYCGSGAAYLFHNDGLNWMQTQKLRPDENAFGDGFGSALATDGTTLVVGAPHFYVPGGMGIGSAYVFDIAVGQPALLQQPASQSVVAGQSATFSVSSGDAATYHWRKDGVGLVDGGHVSGAATAVLTINQAEPADAGAFDVVLTNGCGSVTSAPAIFTVVDSLATVAANPPMVDPYCADQSACGPFRDVLENTTAALVPQGIGVAGTPSEGRYDYATISVMFNATPPSAPSSANVQTSCTDIAGNGQIDCPTVAGVSGGGVGPYSISLSGPPPARECITFTFAGTSPGQKLQYQVLPGDVNLDGQVSTQDILTLIQRINDGTASLPANRARYNINRSNESGGLVVTTQDLLRLVQLFNGTNATQPFAGAAVADCPQRVAIDMVPVPCEAFMAESGATTALPDHDLVGSARRSSWLRRYADAGVVLALVLGWLGWLGPRVVRDRPVSHDTFRDAATVHNVRAGRWFEDPAINGLRYWYAPVSAGIISLVCRLSGAEPLGAYSLSILFWNVWLAPLLYLLLRVCRDRPTALTGVLCVWLGSRWWNTHAAQPQPSIQGVVFVLLTLLLWSFGRQRSLGWAGLVGVSLALCTWHHAICGLVTAAAIGGHALLIFADPRPPIRAERARMARRLTVVAVVGGLLVAPLAWHLLRTPHINLAPIRYVAPEFRNPLYARMAHAPLVPIISILGAWLVWRCHMGAAGWLPCLAAIGLLGSLPGHLRSGPLRDRFVLLPHEFQWHAELALGALAGFGVMQFARATAHLAKDHQLQVGCAAWLGLVGVMLGPELARLPGRISIHWHDAHPSAAGAEAARWIKQHTQITDVFIAEPDHSYFVIGALTGRKIFAPDPAHCNFAFDAQAALRDLKVVFATPDRDELCAILERRHADFALLGPNRADRAVLWQTWGVAEVVFRSADGTLVITRFSLQNILPRS